MTDNKPDIQAPQMLKRELKKEEIVGLVSVID